MGKLNPVERLPKVSTQSGKIIQHLELKPSTDRLAQEAGYELGMGISDYIECLVRDQFRKQEDHG
jgi:hypothetical protein